MALTARILAHTHVDGPEVLDLVTHLARRPGELAVLHSSWGRGRSVVACEPVLTIEIDAAGHARWLVPFDAANFAGRLPAPDPAAPILTRWQAMLDAVILDDHRAPPDAALFGWLGGISYDLGYHLETIGRHARDDAAWPLLRWTLYDAYFVFQHETKQWTLATLEWSAWRKESAEQRFDRLESLLGTVEPVEDEDAAPLKSRLTAHLTHEQYAAKMQRVKEYIAAGDIYQANLAQRWTVQTAAPLERLYRRLCAATPAEFAALLRFDDRAILSASPEMFLERHGPQVFTRPIKGTRPRAPDDPKKDVALRRQLLASAKDKAELAMIVDLLRNDLGRVCTYGSVKVDAPREMEGHPTVWHTVARLRGQLTPEHALGWDGLIAAVCPGGSITGAPKIRAMQIIDELEEARRAWYCGHVGWIGPRQTGALSIAIRSILLQGKTAQVWAGGGIVADSEEAAEYQESVDKARALLGALGVGLDK